MKLQDFKNIIYDKEDVVTLCSRDMIAEIDFAYVSQESMELSRIKSLIYSIPSRKMTIRGVYNSSDYPGYKFYHVKETNQIVYTWNIMESYSGGISLPMPTPMSDEDIESLFIT